MGLGRPTPPLTLTDDERERLGQWVRRPKTAQSLAQRARMMLECSKGQDEHRRGRRVESLESDGWQVEVSVLGESTGRTGG